MHRTKRMGNFPVKSRAFTVHWLYLLLCSPSEKAKKENKTETFQAEV